MSIRTNRNKWRAAKIGGKNISKIYKNGEIIFDYSRPLINPIQGAAIVNISGAKNYDFVAPHSGWFRLIVAAAAGSIAANAQTPGQGAVISHDVYMQQGQRAICWAAGEATTGSPFPIAGNGSVNAGYSAVGGDGDLGGGGASGAEESGFGGGGASGNGINGSINNGSSGGGAGIILYKNNNYLDDANWLLLLLCGGGGGNCGNNGSYRCGGGGGGGGGNGGRTIWALGGTGKYANLANIQHGGDGSRYSAGGWGAGNVIDVSNPNNPVVVKNRTGNNGSRTGYVQIYPLY